MRNFILQRAEIYAIMVSTTKGEGEIPLRTRTILAAAALLLAAGLAAVTHQAVLQADEPLRIGTTYMTMNNPFYSVIDEETAVGD